MAHDAGNWPIVIVGGGLAGCAAAMELAGRGWRVLLVERDRFPRDKLCGEFLSGESRGLLARLGCLDEILQYEPQEISRVRFISRGGRRLDVPLSSEALGISRRVLDRVLFNYARHAGVECLEGHDVAGVDGVGGAGIELSMGVRGGADIRCRAGLLVAAYGRRSKLDRQLVRGGSSNLDGSVGIKLHHEFVDGAAGREAAEELGGTTEMYILDGGYCGVAPVEGGRVNVCMLLSRRAFARVGSADWGVVSEWLGRENRELGRRLAGLVACDEPPLTVSQMPFARREPAGEGAVLYIGDAAGMIAPVCGDGMAMALESGVAAAQCIDRDLGGTRGGMDGVAEIGDVQFDAARVAGLKRAWEVDWAGRFTKRLRAGRMIQGTVFSPAMAEAGLGLLRWAPKGVAGYLARITRG